ncbi:MAG: NADH-quinone oxidoreductase subunit L [Anaerolineaceae bacterium]|nr:NADH-quinone oxidoreductase subunit L [Anaerolineaceae bacterium]
MFELVPFILLFPVLGLLTNLVFGRYLGERFVGIIASGAVAASFIVSVIQVFALVNNNFHVETVLVADWITIGKMYLPWQIRVDTLSVTMMVLVTGVGTLIHIYAVGYMHGDKRFARFFVYLNLFVVMMLVLVAADNYLMLFVGWEGVGICSYLLIGFWYDKGDDNLGNARAGRKAFVVNRIGDFGFLIAMFMIFGAVGSLQFDAVLYYFENHGMEVGQLATTITLLLLVGAAGKSAQIPLFVWLPDAMAGPTPVSALIHAATMVTAGIYMMVRSAPIYAIAPSSQMTVALLGAGTALMAGTIALAQWDIKRVLAYSTISQLGFMVAAVGLGAHVAAMFHLITHAFFKALLFLSAGSVIHGVEHGAHKSDDHCDPQDMRNMGGLKDKMKITFGVYVVGAIALAGIFPLSGFWSKDEILADAWHVGMVEGHWHGMTVYILLALAAVITAFYMTRQIILVFFGSSRSAAANHAAENPPTMTVPLIGLAILSIVGGGINLPWSHTLGSWLEHTHHFFHGIDFNLTVALTSTALAVASIFVGFIVYYRRPLESSTAPDPLMSVLGPSLKFFYNKWYIDELYGTTFVRLYEWKARFLAFKVDRDFWHDFVHNQIILKSFKNVSGTLSGPVDRLGINKFFDGLAYSVHNIAVKVLRPVQTGYVRNYALGVMLGVVMVLGIMLIR